MPAEKVWSLLVADYRVYPVKHVQRLRDLVNECKHVLQVHQQYRHFIKLGSTLPTEYERVLMALDLLCINLYQAERKQLDVLLRKSPGFNRNFKYVTTDDNRHGSTLRFIGNARGKDAVNEAYYRNEPLMYGLQNLCQSPEDVDAFNISFLLGFIDDHLAHADSKERARIDQTLYDHLGRMSLYAEIFVTLRLQRPLHAADAFTYDIATEKEKQRRTWKLWRTTPDNLTEAETRRLSNLLQSFYAVPLPTGKRDKSWLEKTRETHSRLDDFWKAARDVRKREITGIGMNASDIGEDLALFSARDSEDFKIEWAKALQEVQDTIKAGQAAKQTQKEEHPVQSVWGENTGNKNALKLPIRETKVKSRPDKDTSSDSDAVEGADRPEEQPQPETTKVFINSESLRIFARVFPSSADIAFKGIVKWQQFVTAMADAGCSATHTGGSCVRFEVPAQASETDGGTIVFHRPHPENEVDAVMLQTMGKRLRKWFEWDVETFAKREKSA